MRQSSDPPLWLNICVHEVTRDRQAESPWVLDARLLDETLGQLQGQGWVATAPGKPEPEAPQRLLLTLDDARAGALEWLATSDIAAANKATIFPVPLFIDNPDRVPARERYSEFCSWGQLAEATERGHAVGSHGLTHTSFTTLAAHELRRELDGSKRLLEDRFGQQVLDLAPPYGRHNTDVLTAATRSGYQRVHTTRPGLIDRSQLDTRLLCRIVLRSDLPDLGLGRELVTP